MTAIRRRLRRQGGQAMLEYSLIAATVVMGFAAAGALIPAGFWSNNLDEVRNNDYMVLGCEGLACSTTLGKLNQQVEYR